MLCKVDVSDIDSRRLRKCRIVSGVIGRVNTELAFAFFNRLLSEWFLDETSVRLRRMKVGIVVVVEFYILVIFLA